MQGTGLRSAMVRTLQRWMNTLLESQQANRHQLAAVSRAMIRFPDPQFVPGLRQMLERDLTDWAQAREKRAKATHRGPTSPDVTHDHTLGYRSAFVAIGGADDGRQSSRGIFAGSALRRACGWRSFRNLEPRSFNGKSANCGFRTGLFPREAARKTTPRSSRNAPDL